MTMPKVKVYIGDPCYVLGDEYDDFSSAALSGKTEVQLNGESCYVHSTCYGDGVYDLIDSLGDGSVVAQLWVDSGMLSMIPFSALCHEGQNRAESSGAYVTELFEHDSFSYKGGTFHFGHYFCPTE